MTIPEHLQTAVQRIVARVAWCSPASPPSWRLFTQRVCLQTIRDPHAGPDDADAAHLLIALARTDPQSIEAILAADRQLDLFGEGGTR